MSFFGFDTTLPRDRGQESQPRSFFHPTDPFAGLERPAGDRDEDEEDGVNFEDTIEDLGNRMDDADDALNDDTFGDLDTGAATHASVGKDFDFYGQTARVSEAINEEQLRYSRQPPPQKASGAMMDESTRSSSKPVRTGYEKYKDPGAIPDLRVHASLWDVEPKHAEVEAQRAYQEPSAVDFAAAPPARKMMSLEEVEAAMLARNKKQTVPQLPPVQPLSTSVPDIPDPRQALQMHAVPDRTGQIPPTGTITHQGPAPAQPMLYQPPPIEGPQYMPQRQGREPTPLVGPNGPLPVQPRQILQNPNRHHGPVQQHQTRASVSNNFPRSQAPDGYMPRGPMTAHQPPQIMQLSEEDRAVILREEARKAKRNHKIYLLSRDNGLMTPQDKNFITRIQLQQLVTATGNPNEHNTDAGLAEDFYYQVHTQIRGGPRQNPQQPLSYFAQTYLHQTGIRQGGAGGKRINRGGDSHIQRMEQQVQRAVEAAKNKPKGKQLVFEGSLGKISFSNVKTPKAILNIKRSDSSQDVNRPSSRLINERKAQQGGGDRKAILRQIEQVYLTLMQMEDHERRLPSQPGTGVDDVSQHRMEWAQEMKRLNRQLWSELRVMEPIIPNSPVLHPFIAFLSFAKGKKAIPRIFREIDEEQRVTILTMIVVHVGILDVVRLAQLLPGERQPPAAVREEVDLFSQAVMPSVFGYVTEAPLHIVIGLLGILLDSADTQVVARSKVGLAILTMFLSRAELVKQAGDVSDEDWSHWTALYSRLFDTLEPILSNSQRPIFPSSVNLGEDMYVWQFLAAVGLGASPEQQQRLVMAVKDRVMETVALSKTLPLEMASQRLANVNLFMRALGLDVELLA